MNQNDIILVTGGCGFIGSNFVLRCIQAGCKQLINLDILTYAARKENLKKITSAKNYQFIHGDINDAELVSELLDKYKPNIIIHFAAETHVDRSIKNANAFITTNINGTYNLLQQSKIYWEKLPSKDQKEFKFIHVSTDEVYGSLKSSDKPFTEISSYLPNSPYAASKAASNHLVRAWYRSYEFPAIITCCSNNYGPYQHKEKLLPMIITNVLSKKLIPIYGDGKNIRDWLHVSDHCNALLTLIDKGKIGETYNIGGNNEITNIEFVNVVCTMLDEELCNKSDSYNKLIYFTDDRLGHDFRYAIDSNKIKQDLNWSPQISFQDGILSTIKSYLSDKKYL